MYSTLKEHNVSETGPVSFLRWKGVEAPAQLFLLERVNLSRSVIEIAISNSPNGVDTSLLFHLRTETSSFQKVMFFQNIRQWTKSRNSAIPSVIYHCQNPLDLRREHTVLARTNH
jgi:hypothetical protein